MQVFNALAALAPEAAPAERERAPDNVAPPASAVIAAPLIATPDTAATVTPESGPALVPANTVIDVPANELQPDAGMAEPLPEPVTQAGDGVVTIDRVDDAMVVEQSATPAVSEPDPQEPAVLAESVREADAGAGNAEAGNVADSDNPFIESTPPETPAQPRRRGFVVAGIVLAAMLAGQAVFFYRSEIAARNPLARQWLASICAQAGCTLALPQRPQLILIEASDLQVTDPANPNRIQLTATLRNHAGHDVAYPALDLVLTNVNDHTLARRIFLPQDYLGATRDVRSGIAANAELTVRLALETGNLGAAGFRLAVLSAPEP